MPLILFLLTLLLASASHAATFFVDNTCANNGNGTTATCAGSPGGAGPWNTIKNALQVADCSGMNPGDILEIKGHTSQDKTCHAGGNCYFEDNVNIEGACTGIIIQNAANTHVVVDGTQNIQGSTWTSIGSGVYRCSTSGCSGDVGDAFAFRAWYKRGANPEEELDLIQTNITCDTSLPAGKMKIDTSDQSICVHLSDGSSPASAAYFRVPWFDPFLQAGADTSDNMTLRKNPTGTGSFRIQRYRKRGIESNASSNTGWVIDGLEWAYMMDRCIAYADTEGVGNIQIRNNNVSFCGQEGIRLAGDNGNWIIENNVITDIQTEPVFQRCAGIGTGCLPEFTDNGTGIRLVNHQGASGIVRGNVLLRMGGGMNNRARMINFEHDNNNIIVERNYLAHSSGLVNSGTAIMWSGSFDADTNDEINVRNNLIYDVDRCFWVQYGTDYDSQAGTINYILNNHCVEFEEYGLIAQWSGSATLDGVFHVKNNVFRSNTAVPTQIISVPSSGSTGWQTFQNNVFECDACTTNQDIIDWRGNIFERDEDCTASVDCIDNMTTIIGATYSGQRYGDININTSGGTEPDLMITVPSEATDAGQSLTTLVPNDYTGATRPAVFDAGAYNIDATEPPPEGSDFDVSVRRFSLNTVTGLQSLTFTDFSQDCTAVPCAAIFLVTMASADDTAADDALISLGFAADINQTAVVIHDDDGTGANTDSTRLHYQDAVLKTVTASGITGSAMFSSWLAQGLEIDITDAPPTAFFVTVVLMGGPDFLADVGTFTSNVAVDGTTDVTSVGFLADTVLLTGARLTGTSATTALFTVGAAMNDGADTQGAIGCYSQHGVGVSNPHAITSSLYGFSLTDDGGPDFSLQIGGWDTSGFTATTKVVGSATLVSYLALKFGGADFSLIDMDTRTTIGLATHALPYRPLFSMVLGTLARAYDVDEADADGGSCMISFATANNQYSNGVTIEDAISANSNTASLSNDQGIVMEWDDGTCAAGSCFRGHIALEALSLDINYTSVFSDAARKWLGFTIQELAVPGGGGTGSARRGAGLMQ